MSWLALATPLPNPPLQQYLPEHHVDLLDGLPNEIFRSALKEEHGTRFAFDVRRLTRYGARLDLDKVAVIGSRLAEARGSSFQCWPCIVLSMRSMRLVRSPTAARSSNLMPSTAAAKRASEAANACTEAYFSATIALNSATDATSASGHRRSR